MSKDGTAKSYAGYLIDDRYGFLALSEVKDSEDGSSIAEMISEDWEVGDKVCAHVTYHTGNAIRDREAQQCRS